MREQSRYGSSRIESALAELHSKGWQFVLRAATKWSMRRTGCLTLVNEPRLMALSVISEKKSSTYLSQELSAAKLCKPTPKICIVAPVKVMSIALSLE